jgi:branched-chain amino acid transport system substrate-binding protein
MLQVWVKWVNAHGGLSGHPVQVISADDQSNPSTNLSLTQQMVQQNHVVAFLDNTEPLTATANVNYLTQQGIPEVGGDLVSQTWNQYPIMFPQGTAINDLILNGINAAKLSGDSKLGLLYCVETPDCTNEYTQLFTNGGAQKAALNPVYSAQISLTQPDFTVECQQAQSAGVQILALGADANSLERLASNCNALGYHPQYFASSLEVVDSLKSDPLLNGLIAPIGDFPWFAGSTASSAAYLQAIQQYDPSLATSAGTSQMWAAGALLAQAIASLNGGAVTSANIIKALDTIQNNNLGGLAPPLSFTAGQPAPSASCYFVVQIKSGAWTAPKGDGPIC